MTNAALTLLHQSVRWLQKEVNHCLDNSTPIYVNFFHILIPFTYCERSNWSYENVKVESISETKNSTNNSIFGTLFSQMFLYIPIKCSYTHQIRIISKLWGRGGEGRGGGGDIEGIYIYIFILFLQ